MLYQNVWDVSIMDCEQNGDVYLPLNFKTECDSFSFSLILGKCGISAKVARMVA